MEYTTLSCACRCGDVYQRTDILNLDLRFHLLLQSTLFLAHEPDKKVKLFSNQCSRKSEDSFWKVVRLHPYVFLVRATWRWSWVRSVGGMITKPSWVNAIRRSNFVHSVYYDLSTRTKGKLCLQHAKCCDVKHFKFGVIIYNTSCSMVCSTHWFHVHPSIHPPTPPSIHPSICLSVYLSIFLSVCLSVCLSICLSIHPPSHTSISPFIYMCVCVCVSLHLSNLSEIKHWLLSWLIWICRWEALCFLWVWTEFLYLSCSNFKLKEFSL